MCDPPVERRGAVITCARVTRTYSMAFTGLFCGGIANRPRTRIPTALALLCGSSLNVLATGRTSTNIFRSAFVHAYALLSSNECSQPLHVVCVPFIRT